MSRPSPRFGRVGLALVLGLSVVVVGAATGIANRLGAGPANQRVSGQPVRYWAETIALRTAAATALQAAGISAQRVPREQANLVLTQASQPGAVAVLPNADGQPAALQSARIVAPVDRPAGYATATTKSAKQALAKLKTSTQSAPAWSMLAAGDIGLGRSIYTSMRDRGSTSYPLEAFADQFRAADLAIANLECALSDDHAVVSTSGMSFVAPFSAAAGLKAAGFDALSVANNHSFNGGAAGYLDTLAELERLGITAVGGGRTSEQARAPRIVTVKGVRVALLGYSAITGSTAATASSPGMNYISMAPWGALSEADVSAMEQDIRTAKAQADVVIPYFHWGVEYTHQANADQRTVAHRAVAAGADVVLGAHPHWTQGVEWYNGHLITYSLGNFIFDQDWAEQTKQGTLLKLGFVGSTLTSAELVPYHIYENLQPRPAANAEAHDILASVFDNSWWVAPKP